MGGGECGKETWSLPLRESRWEGWKNIHQIISKCKNTLRLNTVKKGYKLPQEHIIEKHVLSLGNIG